MGIEEFALAQHGAAHGEQPVGDRAQGASVRMAALAQGPILGAADGIVLDRDAAPVIGGVDQARLGGPAAEDPPCLAGALGDRGHPAQAAEGFVVSGMQRSGSLCEQLGEDGSPDARQRREDLRVTLLSRLPRCRLLAGGELPEQVRERAVRTPELLVEQAEPLGEEPDMRGGGVDDARGRGHRIGTQGGEHPVGLEAPQAVFFQQLGDRGRADSPRGVGSGGEFPEGQGPVGGQVGPEFEELRVVAPELLADAVGKAGALLGEVVRHAGPLAQLGDRGVEGAELAQAVRVGADGVSEDAGVAAVVLQLVKAGT